MSVLFLVLPLALLASATAVLAFVWAAKTGQLDDLTTPALRAIDDDEKEGPARGPVPPLSGERQPESLGSVSDDQ